MHVVPLRGMQRWHGVCLTYVLANLAGIAWPHARVLPLVHLQLGRITTYADVLLLHDAWLPRHHVGHARCILLDAKVLVPVTIKHAADAQHPPVPIAYVRPIFTLLNYTVLNHYANTMETPQLACQAKGLCRALPVHASTEWVSTEGG